MKAQNKVSDELNTEVVNAEASIIIPFGQLANKFDYAQSYGFWFSLGEDHGWYANLGINGILLKNARPVGYKFNDSVYKINSNKFGLDVGIRAVKIILVSNKNYLEFDATIGIHYLDYDFPTEKDEDGNKKDEPFLNNTAILIAPEIKYIFTNVGFKFQYRFTPYNVIEGIESNFGSHSISFGIVYKQ